MNRRSVTAALVSVVLAVSGCGGVVDLLDTTTTSSAIATTTSSTSAPTTTTAATTTTAGPTTSGPPDSEALSYFSEIALGAEFGGADQTIRKWNQDVHVVVRGQPTPEDLATLSDVLADLNVLIDTIEFDVVDDGGNIDLYFVPESEFSSIVPEYQPINLGFFWVYWSTDTITEATILITTVGVTQRERSHLIREELTQSLGLMNDSYRYEDSIFYQGWTDTDHYSPIDELVISILYRPEVRFGMNAGEALAVLGG